MSTVPRSWRGVTPEWMTAALARRWPGCVVESVVVTGVEQGTNRRAALRLSYRSGAGPAAVFVKLQGRVPHRLALVALGALHAEARLALAGVTLPVERPEVFAAGLDRRRLRTVVVMDDVRARGGRPNRATDPLPVADVEAGLEELARLHAAFWGGRWPPALAFLRPWRLGAAWAPVSAASLAVGRARLARLPGPARSGTGAGLPAGTDVRALERQFRRSAALAATGPQTVLHGDAHPGNTYALPGGRTGFYDWQLARIGHWSHDAGYFLVSSLDPADRRAHERDLLKAYRAALRAAGVDPPSADEAWARYRATPAYGLAAWLHTLAAGTFQPADVAAATIRRFAVAYEDLGTARSSAAVGRPTSPRRGPE